MAKTTKSIDATPRVSPWLLGWFRWYLRGYLPRGLHSLCVATDSPLEVADETPLIVFLNHASWWDPVVSIHLSAVESPGRTIYAPFDEAALERYPIFERLGFFGVDQTSRRGAAQFLRTTRAVLGVHGASVWMTPEGRFVDPRDDTAPFEPGLAHLAHHLATSHDQALRQTVLRPLAIEYPLWEERLPECLCRWGKEIRVADHAGLSKAEWNTLLEEQLRSTQRRLAEISLARDPAAFRVLLGGSEGVGGLYERFRRTLAWLRGQPYRAAHGEKLRKPQVPADPEEERSLGA
ncbi:lysophospholipid acyltransferase family protein [Botrimarina hoheduenensis]|uniref:Acyltransferase n=1 Tax=Botrimarina hoheduenensis TaxID=2528000 RepID=A0A5C5VWW1_9BACT|nr:lysophospholipid acyltransferase family protein [Botrimarina hoheduenensis]TWT43146.1 Acyltransferase [Botrimarina hoheduenensis]